MSLTYEHRGRQMSGKYLSQKEGSEYGYVTPRTAESTSYTRKPEFKFVSGVIDGPIQEVVSAD